MTDQVVELPLPNEPRNTLSIRLRTRSDGRPTFQARRIIPLDQRRNPRNPYKTKSLNTDCLDTAKTLAYEWEREINTKIVRSEPLDDVRFAEVALRYLKWAAARTGIVDANGISLVSANALKRETTSILRYLIPFFGDRDIRQIKHKDVQNFLEWRMGYYIDGPGSSEDHIAFKRDGVTYHRPLTKSVRPTRSTINKDAVAYAKVIRHAHRVYDLPTETIPKISLPRSRSEGTRRRPRFDDDEWHLLMHTAEDRSVMSAGVQSYYRHVMCGLLTLLHGTGIRVSEAMWLQVRHMTLRPVTDRSQREWDDLPDEWDDDGVVAFKATMMPIEKGRVSEFRVTISKDNPGLKQLDHARTVIPSFSFSEPFAHHLAFLAHRFSEDRDWQHLPGDLYLFPTPEGGRVKTMRKAFEGLMAAAKSSMYPEGLKMKDGMARTLSSVRHTYASKQIEAGATKHGIGFLADNMGTSTEMIRKHYGQALKELRAEDLQGY